MLDRIKACFTESIQTQIAAAEALPDAISRAAMTLVQSLLNGNKILCCGNGTSAANAQHFAASMINRFETERPGLPAIALNTDNVVLTAIANDRLHDEIYAKQVRALGHAGDVLLAISTRGNSRDIVKAVEAAVTRDMTIVALTGYDGGELAGQSPTPDLSARAKQIAMGVEGTTEVFNEVRQGQPIGLGTASSDTWITTKVRSQLLSTDQVKSSNVKVTTENSEVFLMGLVTDREGRAAADIASRVSGVSRVTTAFTYIK
ncbi:TPA: divisome-associated lipoprotein YraP [Klebsiella pneumoniae]|nr:divisome-associated lipoprotein YraP [Klebsiella pneumoniae]HBV1843965.1 divisome-associated lipoprotein YraP [Klebsiella pneumoniae]HBV1869735.1 divisome-associated lipoprotein YraP [Klebsiella pneumoniae]HBV1877838.1 divisome-associated lipoprotein YraP [Klebsiella pneumoniae]HBV1915481.1 divisome-associated lipoprotein YraP [Klebsiella pneumoniae]